MKLTDKAVSATHRVLLYGPPKSGKSKEAGDLSQFKKLLWFDFENGYTTLLQLPDEWKERIEIISIPDTKSYPIAIETALKVIKGGPVSICEEHGKVSCPLCKKENKAFTEVNLSTVGEDTVVVFDSLTQLTASAIAHITKSQPDDYKLDYTDWTNLGRLMETFLSHIQQAKYNVVCISHEIEAEQEDGRTKLVPVSGTRNASRNTGKYFDHVVYCEVKNKKHNYYSSTIASNNISTGSRTSVSLEGLEGSPLMALFDPKYIPTKDSTQKPAVQQNAATTTKLNSILANLKK